MALKLDSKPRTQILVAYAPHAHKPTEEKKSFYEQLTDLVKETKGGMLIIGGDFNARLGAPIDGEEANIIGGQGYTERNLEDESQEVQEILS